MFKITQHPYFIRLFKIIDNIANSRIWKWLYWFGISIGGFILMLNIYDTICVLFIDGYEFRVKKITSDREAIFAIINSTIFAVLPCFISLFAMVKYIYRIVGIIIYFILFTESDIIFYPDQYITNIAILAIVILSFCAVIFSRIWKFSYSKNQNKSEAKHLVAGLLNLLLLIFLGWITVSIFFLIYQKIMN